MTPANSERYFILYSPYPSERGGTFILSRLQELPDVIRWDNASEHPTLAAAYAAIDPFQNVPPFFLQTPKYPGQHMAMTSAYRRASNFIDWFIRSRYMEGREFGSSSDMWIEDPERAQRCEDAASDGADGSTHAEHIADWRSAVSDWFHERYGWNGHDRFQDAITMYLDELESWHEMNGTLWQQIN